MDAVLGVGAPQERRRLVDDGGLVEEADVERPLAGELDRRVEAERLPAEAVAPALRRAAVLPQADVESVVRFVRCRRHDIEHRDRLARPQADEDVRAGRLVVGQRRDVRLRHDRPDARSLARRHLQEQRQPRIRIDAKRREEAAPQLDRIGAVGVERQRLRTRRIRRHVRARPALFLLEQRFEGVALGGQEVLETLRLHRCGLRDFRKHRQRRPGAQRMVAPGVRGRDGDAEQENCHEPKPARGSDDGRRWRQGLSRSGGPAIVRRLRMEPAPIDLSRASPARRSSRRRAARAMRRSSACPRARP